MPSYFEVINPIDVQEAYQDARTLQQRRNLAVMPQPDISRAVRRGLTFGTLGMQTKLEERRLDLDENAARYQRRMQPYAVGIGVLDVGVNYLSGLRAKKLAEQRDMQRQQILTLQREALEERRRQTGVLQDIFARRRRQQLAPYGTALLSGYPTSGGL